MQSNSSAAPLELGIQHLSKEFESGVEGIEEERRKFESCSGSHTKQKAHDFL